MARSGKVGDLVKNRGAGHVQIFWRDKKGKAHNIGFYGDAPIDFSGYFSSDLKGLKEAADYQVIVPNMDAELTEKAVNEAIEGWWEWWYTAGVHDCQRFAATVYLEYLRLGGRREEDLPGWFERDMKAAEKPEPEKWDDFRKWFLAPLEVPVW